MDEWKGIWNDKGKLTEENIAFDLIDIRDGFALLKKMMGITTIGTERTPDVEGFISQFDENYNMMTSLKKRVDSPWSFFDVGCGSGSYLFLLQRKYGISVVGGMDYSDSLISIARKAVLNPRELYAEDAANLRTDIKYDVVFSRSIFQYFPDENYARRVAELMLNKANYSIAILDVYDIDKKDDFIKYRQSNIKDYEKKYKKTNHLFLSKKTFEQIADENNSRVVFSNSELPGYWNGDYTYDVYMYFEVC